MMGLRSGYVKSLPGAASETIPAAAAAAGRSELPETGRGPAQPGETDLPLPAVRQ